MRGYYFVRDWYRHIIYVYMERGLGSVSSWIARLCSDWEIHSELVRGQRRDSDVWNMRPIWTEGDRCCKLTWYWFGMYYTDVIMFWFNLGLDSLWKDIYHDTAQYNVAMRTTGQRSRSFFNVCIILTIIQDFWRTGIAKMLADVSVGFDVQWFYWNAIGCN